MDAKLLRGLIYLFLGLIALFLLLMLVNFVGARLRPAPREEKRDNVADSYMQGHNTNPVIRQKLPADPGSLPSGRAGLSPATGEGIKLVKNKEFGGVAERPQDLMAELQKKSQERKKPAPIALKSLDAAVVPPAPLGGAGAVSAGSVPELGRGANMEGVTLISVDVKFKLFTSAGVWLPFRDSHGIKAPSPDFASSDVLILVPGGDYPAGILSVAGVEKSPKETVVKYRVNPLAMAAGLDEGARENYAFASVPKKKSVRLLQVP